MANNNPATHNSPRTWFLTSSLSPLCIRLIRLLLAHGDYVVACLPPVEIEDDERSAEFRELINECKSSRKDREGWKDRIRGIRCDGRAMGQCGAAIAEAVHVFGRIDILLCCKFEAVIGTVEELSATPATRNLVRDQFDTIFFSQVNFIKAALPQLRAQHTGHIMILTSIGGHIGTPCMPMYTAATWALEGYCDSLAYEIAPFNIKVTIVQPNKEIQSLTNKIIFAPQLPCYDADLSPAPSMREMLANVLNANPDTALADHHPAAAAGSEDGDGDDDNNNNKNNNNDNNNNDDNDNDVIQYRYPRLPAPAYDKLVMETVHALTAIGGHENPPARHIVGFEGAVAVKEKLKTVTEELEDFVEASLSVDIFESELNAEARQGRSNIEVATTPGGAGSGM
jgi:NAD(P)-dependent dehydrogenase (short-subunit alcohol dehydrogenase family)